jgi:hypothetical protein
LQVLLTNPPPPDDHAQGVDRKALKAIIKALETLGIDCEGADDNGQFRRLTTQAMQEPHLKSLFLQVRFAM